MRFTTLMLISGTVMCFIVGLMLLLIPSGTYTKSIFLFIIFPASIMLILMALCIAISYLFIFLMSSSLVYSFFAVAIAFISYILGSNIGYDSASALIQSQTGLDPNDIGMILNQMSKISTIFMTMGVLYVFYTVFILVSVEAISKIKHNRESLSEKKWPARLRASYRVETYFNSISDKKISRKYARSIAVSALFILILIYTIVFCGNILQSRFLDYTLSKKFIFNTNGISCKNLPSNYQIFFPIDQRNFMNSNKKVIIRFVDNNIYTYQYQNCLKN